MRRWAQFALVLVLGVAALTWGAYAVLSSAARGWFERDTALRGRLVGTSTGPTILERVERQDEAGLVTILDRITRDERIMATALCGEASATAGSPLLAATDFYPREIDCDAVAQRRDGAGADEPWFFVSSQPGGRVQIGAIPLVEDGQPRALLVLVHDLGYIDRRESQLRTLLLIAFFILAIGGSGLTVLAARVSWAGWTEDLRRTLRGESRTRAFLPLMRDVRELADRLAAEAEPEQAAGRWSPERLRAALTKHLEGDRIVVVANREPYIHERDGDAIRVVHPASGLVTALEPVMRACSGVWVAHGSGSADRETVDAKSHVHVPPGEESYDVRRVWLSEQEEQGYYYGFSNEGLWPLCHVAHTRPTFRESDWRHYCEVNERFAAAACEEAETDDPIILVQDYHFALVPKMIRRRLPRATILTFWHIPWPNAERFGICPWRNEIIDGLLGSSIIGFHTRQHCNHFLDAVDTFVESRIDRERHAVVQGSTSTLVRAYPISIEWPVHWLQQIPSAAECRREIFQRLGIATDGLLGVGIDRLDYTKGIEERLLAVERLLEKRPSLVGRFVFAQLAAPSRTRIPRYHELNDAVEALAAKINARFRTGDYKPIALLRAHHEPPAVYRYFRAADLCFVSSVHDGMNLVAKEFVAARDDERGVLVLSRFTGAARELTEALIVNPYDVEESSAALAAALDMPVTEQAVRMRSMRAVVSELNVYRWAGRMLVDAAAVRRKERLSGRLSASWSPLRGATT